MRVLYETLWSSPADGWAIAARAYARAMALAKIDVRLKSWLPLPPNIHPDVLEEVFELFGKPPTDQHNIHVFCTAFGKPSKINPALRVLASGEAKTVFYTTLERNNIAPETVRVLKHLSGVWVPCTRNAEVLAKAGVAAKAIPHCYFDDHPNLRLEASHKADVFGWVGRWEPRKAPDNLIKAFMRAFQPGEATLIMKLSPTGPIRWKGLPHTPEEAMLNECRLLPLWSPGSLRDWIKVIREPMTSAQMSSELYSKIDVYVSASRGEGWDLPSFESKLAGRRVITTDSGGPRDFITESDILIPSTGEIDAVDYFDLWGAGAKFNDYDIDQLVAALQRAKASPRAGERPSTRFRAQNVGEEIKTWLGELL